ncbi:hypothetical protein Taro_044278 [Colocasia esculenta]|uniref:Transposase Tnp1/En/Spm-like domain-containing protein n=1 Tax=Colocasia esculenta TaxID=4460 RepID=A0A843WIQ5_COLES|nr:hypothetical protein [Colocasia esculenta]
MTSPLGFTFVETQRSASVLDKKKEAPAAMTTLVMDRRLSAEERTKIIHIMKPQAGGGSKNKHVGRGGYNRSTTSHRVQLAPSIPTPSERSSINKFNREKQIVGHTAGSKSFAMIREEISMLHEESSPEENTSPRSMKDDLLSQVLGKDKPGRIRMLGLGPTPSSAHEDNALPSICSSASSREVQYHNVQQGSNKRGRNDDILNAQGKAMVYLKSFKKSLINVALATIESKDPLKKVGSCDLGYEYWEVAINVALVHNEPLPRPYAQFKTIGATIAWPFTLIFLLIISQNSAFLIISGRHTSILCRLRLISGRHTSFLCRHNWTQVAFQNPWHPSRLLGVEPKPGRQQKKFMKFSVERDQVTREPVVEQPVEHLEEEPVPDVEIPQGDPVELPHIDPDIPQDVPAQSTPHASPTPPQHLLVPTSFFHQYHTSASTSSSGSSVPPELYKFLQVQFDNLNSSMREIFVKFELRIQRLENTVNSQFLRQQKMTVVSTQF